MKRSIILFTLTVAFLASSSLFAQGRFGADSAECIKYLSFYQEYMKQNNMKEAAPLWRKTISLCPPQANQNMLLDGMKILRRDISIYQSNPIRKAELVDSLMLLHEARINTYPKYATTAKINKALDFVKYHKQGQEQELLDAIKDAMDQAGDKSPVSLPVRYMEITNKLYAAGSKGAEDVMMAFEEATAVATKIQAAKPSEESDKCLNDVENLFMQSGVANCDNLIALFQPRYEENPTDKDVLTGIITMLSASKCTDSDLFVNAVESLHKTDKSHKSSYTLYRLYSDKNNNEKAIEYMEEALALLENDDKQEADYNYELSTFYYKKVNNIVKAVAHAKAAAELDSEIAGKCYFLIGTIWGSLKCSGNDIEVRAPYWVAVDYMAKAKNLDSSLASEATNMIAQYSKYFPQQSEAFMFDVLDGSAYTVSCSGLRENTKVRTQK